MRICPYCGYYNPDSSVECIDCKQSLIVHGNQSTPPTGRVCPNCGYSNTNQAETCLRCDYRLVEPDDEPESPEAPEPAASIGSIPLPPLPFSRSDTMIDTAIARIAALLLFLLGVGLDLAIGFAFAAVSPQTLGSNICLLFLGMLVLGGLFVFPKKTRLFGYGLLAGAFSFPIWIQSSCVPIQYYR